MDASKQVRVITPEMEAKLKRLEVLEAAEATRAAEDLALKAESEKLLTENERLKKAMVERGMQPDQHGIRYVETEIEVEVERDVVTYEDKEVADKDNPGQTKTIRKKIVSKEMVKEMKTVEMVELHIDLPPSGGIRLTRNGVDFFHGQTYLFTPDVAADVREQMYRSWGHEQNIKGSDENAYRPHNTPILNGRRSFARR